MALILIVEDNETQRELLRAFLELHDHEIREASDGLEALAMMEEWQCDLVITDHIMPGMNGDQLYQTLVKIRPKLKVLYMSGYLDATIESHGVIDSAHHFLQKPFSVLSLTRKIREVLDS